MMVSINTVRSSVERLYSQHQITAQERSEARYALTFRSNGMEIDTTKLPTPVATAVEAEFKACQPQSASS